MSTRRILRCDILRHFIFSKVGVLQTRPFHMQLIFGVISNYNPIDLQMLLLLIDRRACNLVVQLCTLPLSTS